MVPVAECMPIMKKRIYAIILNYNNYEDTIACIDSFSSVSSVDYSLVVVDNGSKRGCLEKLERFINQREEAIALIKEDTNLGYAAGNNVGIKYAIEHGAEYIAIINNDVLVNDTSFAPCIEILESNDKCAFVGPAMLERNSNRIQYTGGKVDIFRSIAGHLNQGRKYSPSEYIIDCDYVGGACMVFRASIIDVLGALPECYFLFWEETEWCIRAKKIGMKCLCTMKGYIHHKGSASIKKEKGYADYYLQRNRIIFAKRNNDKAANKAKSILWIFANTIVRGILIDRCYFKRIPYYVDGLIGFDRFAGARKLRI